jgi:CRP/FNR family transcriptional regulator
MVRVRTANARPDEVDLLPYLRGHELFGALPEAALAELAATAVERTYRRGHYIAYAGDPANYVVTVRSGLVALMDTDVRGNAHVLLLLHAGQAFGLGPTLLNRRFTWTSVAIAATQAVLVPSETFAALYDRYPAFAHAVARELARITVRCGETVLRFAFGSATARVAAFLLEASQAQRGSAAFDLILTHQELAALVGTTRETVTRVLQRLAEAEVISITKRRVLLHQPDVLQRLADR